jgi:uncharacterized protein
MYTMADQTWRARPRVMSRTTVDRVAFRIAEHARAHGTRAVQIVLHGGEPLLAGPEAIAYTVTAIRAALDDGQRAYISVQTNGLLLDEQFLELFDSLDVKVGLSLDGDADMHDRHRRRLDGRGSYARTAAVAAQLAGYRRLFSGFLSVIDLRNDPVLAYESLLRFSPPAIDFLLPHGTWSTPPPGRPAGSATAPYGDWLIQVFDRWYQATERETSIRLFDEIINLLLGGSSGTEEIGLSPVAVVVIESDGAIEQSDMLKAAYQGAAATGLNVAGNPFDAALLTAGTTRQARLGELAAKCRACPVGRICGGGLHAHRYRAENGFDNPSVYCPDLYRLITHIRARVVADLNRLSPRGA